ncbi:MAG: tRNA uridine-5-carboxymethylaminomethyl(34) synthesis enzyme MnmG [Verrucomicrobiales bacterium]|nr:MAG: tRNA uridine-5-carboxymethylaminomethyl(34) synthesis enzyme MnmG [Verrucomicrobiales bacterium]
MFIYPKNYDVIVIGAGHAGIEASLAAARMGCQVLLLTTNVDTIGQMSCNPAIGGSAKGHLVKEIDALGGEMGRNTDFTGLQFRVLNRSKGPAIRATRVQCDKKAYQLRMKWVCEREPNLDVKQGQTISIESENQIAQGATTSTGVRYLGKTVIITTGTFLHGLMHIGKDKQLGGRSGEMPSIGLSDSLKSIGIELRRLKTGTPPRLLKRSINYSKLEEQGGDTPIPFFSVWPLEEFHVEQNPSRRTPKNSSRCFPSGSIIERIGGQTSCFLTKTTLRTKEIVRDNLHLSPMYSGEIEGVGPRYCPSIEDKVINFSQKETHQIFLEPEGINTDEIYINGLSTCLPFEVQIQLVKSVLGCENAEIIRPAYAVEYDYSPPTQISPTLETKVCQNLFLAGQINGTSGYEEAAAQGLMAGINAARKCQNKEPIVLARNQAYIGVMIDDLVNLGTNEPYRIFTSRSEYRLLLRQDNADQRLSRIAHEIGLLPSHNFSIFTAKRDQISDEIQRLKKTRFGTDTLAQMLRRPETMYDQLPQKNDLLSPDVKEAVEIEIKYEGYINRQISDVERAKTLESKAIPQHFDCSSVLGLSVEAKQKLTTSRPITLGQASRISGVSPADIGLLAVWLKRYPTSVKSQPSPSECSPSSENPAEDSEL